MPPVTSTNRKVISLTNDLMIREALMQKLAQDYSDKDDLKVIPELGVSHGNARIDIAVVNGVMHGYEIKSDRDTLSRLSEQAREYNTVFDQITLVVGKRHLFDAIREIHEWDWWGVMLVKINENGKVVFQSIREPKDNPHQVKESIARLLWREEALQKLEKENMARGFRSKPREHIYQQLAEIMEMNELKAFVRKTLLVSREGWRPDVRLMTSGG